MGKLYAIADLHLGHQQNVEAWKTLTPRPEDSLIIAGDVGEKAEHLRLAFGIARERFKQVFWVPGNHELYTMPSSNQKSTSQADSLNALTGVSKYLGCVELARECGVITPEDDYVRWDDGNGNEAIICPIFTLYDYSFRPAHVTRERALDWALEVDIQATDEALLHPTPYETRDEWCHARVALTEPRLQAAADTGLPLIIINHWPLREDLIYIPFIPRFSLWCGTKKTEDWHKRFKAKVVVTGHLHVRRSDWKDETRFEEVSLGYPRQWKDAKEHGNGINEILREILPGPDETSIPSTTIWRRYG
ncbi:metallophosphoesterase-like protein [Stachybotrys elegans]|uniref:Metallophosphoesterase-like protein n=1 Tax=Stachybotrys elegans TaxID=80388 RepID=A0A8K0WQA8_9HYPO|nr:metallophosphoesterase-like protein [Stachybotrys elegans]